jgi:hypothetical protein
MDPSTFKDLSIRICIFSEAVLVVILVNALKLGIVGPSVGPMAVFFTVEEVSLIDLTAFVDDSAFSVQGIFFEASFISESWG